MIDKLLLYVYISNIPVTIIVALILLALWFVIGVVFKRNMRVISAVVVVLSVAVILYATVFSRSGSTNNEYYLIPFSSFIRGDRHLELYRSMMMNVLLFLPLGVSLPYVFDGDIGRKIVLTITIGFVLSVTLEFAQYILALGIGETDDVICNTIGTAIGCCAYSLFLSIYKLIKKKKDSFDE